MVWGLGQTMKLYQTPALVDIDSRGEWDDLVVMPTEDVRVGHDYLFVLTGMMGGWFNRNLTGASFSEVTFREASSVYQVQHRMDMDNPRFDRTKGRFALPFQIMVRVGSAQAVPYRMSWRCDSRPTSNGYIDAPTMQVWDLTEIGSANFDVRFDVTAKTLSQATPQSAIVGPTLTEGMWLVQYAADIEQRAVQSSLSTENVGAASIWLSKSASDHTRRAKNPRQYFSGTGPQYSHIGVGPRASAASRANRGFMRVRLGDFHVFNANELPVTPTVYAQQLMTNGVITTDRILRMDMACIRLDAAVSEVGFQKRLQSAVSTPGSRDDLMGLRDSPRTVTIGMDTPIGIDAVLMTGCRVWSDGRVLPRKNGFAGDVAYEVDSSGIVNPVGWEPTRGVDLSAIHVLCEDVSECLPIHRHYATMLDVGTTCHRLSGRIVERTGDNVGHWAQHSDIEILQFTPVKNYIEPQPVLQNAGPRVIVPIDREAPAAVGLLPALPAGGSKAHRVSTERSLTQLRSENAYVHNLSEFASAVDVWQFEYRNVDESARFEVELWLQGLHESSGAFRARPEDLKAEAAFVLQAQSGWSVERAGLLFTIRFRAIEVRFGS